MPAASGADKFVDYWKGVLPEVDQADGARRTAEWYEPVAQCLVTNHVVRTVDLVDLNAADLIETPQGTHMAFVRRAINFYTRQAARREANQQSGGGATATAARVKVPRVDFAAKLGELRLTALSDGLWPSQQALDALAADLAKLREAGVTAPFVAADVRSFLPAWAKEGGGGSAEDDLAEPSYVTEQLAKALSVPIARKRRMLCANHWAAGYDRLALASDACGMWDAAIGMRHKDTCFRVGEELKAKGLGVGLLVEYDDVVRRKWENKSRLGVRLAFDALVAEIDRAALDLVVAGANKSYSSGNGGSKGGGKGAGAKGSGERKCYNCGMTGHMAKDCAAKGSGKGGEEGAKRRRL